MEVLAMAARMATDLLMMEDQRQGVSQHPNHRQHHERRTFGGPQGGMAVDGQGLKYLGIQPDRPRAGGNQDPTSEALSRVDFGA
jgi:hypothetical protein